MSSLFINVIECLQYMHALERLGSIIIILLVIAYTMNYPDVTVWFPFGVARSPHCDSLLYPINVPIKSPTLHLVVWGIFRKWGYPKIDGL